MKVTNYTILAVASITLLLITLLAPAQASARDKGPQDARYAQNDTDSNTRNNDRQKGKHTSRNPDSQNEAPTVSRSEAAAIAERETGGRVLSVRESGRYWQVKVLVDEKRVRYVNVDMRSGRVN